MSTNLSLQLSQLTSEFFMSCQHFAQFNECTYDEHAHLNCLLAVQHVGGHDRTVFSEDVGPITAATAFF